MWPELVHVSVYIMALSPSLHAVYNNKRYIDIVQHAAELSMAAAIEEVKAMSHYDTDGEARNTYSMQPHVHVSVYVCIFGLCTIISGSSPMQGMIPPQMPTTLLCHVSREGQLSQRSMHYVHIHVLCSTHKVVGISTLSRADHGIPQTREVACTKEVLPQVIARG